MTAGQAQGSRPSRQFLAKGLQTGALPYIRYFHRGV